MEDSPALYASRKVVVVVEMRTMSSAPAPSPMLLMPTAMLSCPREASPMPSIYIQMLPIVYTIAEVADAVIGAFDSLV